MNISSFIDQMLGSNHLNVAYLQFVRNKEAAGVDGMEYIEVRNCPLENGEIIKEQLRRQKYKPQRARRVEIPKSDGDVRNLRVPSVTDRLSNRQSYKC